MTLLVLDGDGGGIVRRYPLAIWVGIVFSLALATSALYWDHTRVVLAPDSEWATIAQLRAEYREATERLELPEGQTWPQLPYLGAEPVTGETYTYGAGVGAEWAEWYWFDVWATEAVSGEDSATRAAALRQLPEFFQMTAFTTTMEAEYFNDMITRSQSGDDSVLREYVSTVDLAARNGGQTDE